MQVLFTCFVPRWTSGWIAHGASPHLSRAVGREQATPKKVCFPQKLSRQESREFELRCVRFCPALGTKQKYVDLRLRNQPFRGHDRPRRWRGSRSARRPCTPGRRAPDAIMVHWKPPVLATIASNRAARWRTKYGIPWAVGSVGDQLWGLQPPTHRNNQRLPSKHSSWGSCDMQCERCRTALAACA